MTEQSKEKQGQKIDIHTGNTEVLTITLLNDISLKLAKIIELLEKK